MKKIPLRLSNVKYLVFEGGGGKGYAYLGAIQALEELIKDSSEDEIRPIIENDSNSASIINPPKLRKYFDIKGIAGTSAGAITALMLALGLTSEEIKKEGNGEETGFKFTDFFSNDEPLNSEYRSIIITKYTADIKYLNDDFNKEITTKKDNKKKKYYKIKDISFGKVKQKYVIPDDNGKDEKLIRRNFINPIYMLINRILKISLRVNTYSLALSEMFGKTHDDNPILTKFNKDVDAYTYNFLFDKGLFSGSYIRHYFGDLIERRLREKYPNSIQLSNMKQLNLKEINFEDFKQITRIDFRVIGSNITYGKRVEFSAGNTPDFPVAEAVAISMNIPGVFKPVFVNNDEFDKKTGELKSDARNKVPSGFYGDGGMLDNFSIDIFDTKDYNKNTLGFMVTYGPNPIEYNTDSPEFTGEEDYKKYIDNYYKRYNDLPEIIEPESMKEPGKYPSGISILSYMGNILNMFLNYSTNKRFDDEKLREKNVIEVFSYDIGTLMFSPKNEVEIPLFDFVARKAKDKTCNILQ